MGNALVIGASREPARAPTLPRSFTLRWWSQIRVPRLHHDVNGTASIAYDLCWAQTSLLGVTEDEQQFLHLLLGPPTGSRQHRQHAEPNNWLVQRIMAGVEGAVYGIQLQLDTPAQAAERQPQRTQDKDPATATQTYGGVTGTVLAPGVHPFDIGI